MYFVRLTRGIAGKIRDGVGFDAPMKEVDCDSFTAFDNLPKGALDFGTAGLEIRRFDNDDDALRFMTEQETAAQARKATRDAAHQRAVAKVAELNATAKAHREKLEAEKLAQAAPASTPARMAHVATGDGRRRPRRVAEE